MKNDFVIDGDITRIFLTRKNGCNQVAMVETRDLSIIQSFPNTWYSVWDIRSKSYYVRGQIRNHPNPRKQIAMHRLLLGDPEGKLVDHINRNTLDNTRNNLRISTHITNGQNKNVECVSWHKLNKKWIARIVVNKKAMHLGYFNNFDEAREVVRQARAIHMPFSQ